MTLVDHADWVPVPRATKFPVEIRMPEGFRVDDPGTWPRVEGRLEYVGGKLLFMPPCGDLQAPVATSVSGLLDRWSEVHSGFIIGSNEAGMILEGEARGADAAVWRAGDLGDPAGRYYRVPPVLAVEIAGADEEEPELRDKASWYLGRDVEVVWLVFPGEREVLVLSSSGERRYGTGQTLDPHPSLPGLEPAVDRFFRQLQ